MSEMQVLEVGSHRELRSVEPPGFADSAVALAEANHRIANNLSLLASAVAMRASEVRKQERPLSGSEAAAILAEVGTRIAMVGQVHRLLSKEPEETHLDLAEHLAELCTLLIDVLAPPGAFEFRAVASEPCFVATDDVLPVCLIVTEVVTNSLKYSHPSGVAGRLMFECRRTADGSVTIELGDDGVGLPEGFDFSRDGGIGSRTIRVLSKKIGAEVSYEEREIGAWFTLRVRGLT